MKRPDLQRMVLARAEIDEHLNKVLVLLVPPPDASIVNAWTGAGGVVKAHINAARHALDRFEEACHA